MMNDMNIFVRKTDFSHSLRVFITEVRGDARHVAEPLKMRPIEDGVACDETLSIGITAAQQLIDELWVCGLRPSEGTGSAGALAATQKHLEDMRTMVFCQLGVNKGDEQNG